MFYSNLLQTLPMTSQLRAQSIPGFFPRSLPSGISSPGLVAVKRFPISMVF